MKYKAKIYRCDPDTNIPSTKANCYRTYPMCCRHTFDKEYRMTNIWKRIKEDYQLWKYHKKRGLRLRDSSK